MTSRVVERGGMVFVHGVPPEPRGDVTEQTRRVLERIDRLLALAGSHKSRLLTAQIKLSDLNLLEQHESAWDEWVDPSALPVRAVTQTVLQQPGALVEIAVTARK